VTGKVHDAVRCNASSAVQATTVVPTSKLDPLVGVQDVVRGASPPEAVGGAYMTVTGPPFRLCSVTALGQLIAGGEEVGFVVLSHPN